MAVGEPRLRQAGDAAAALALPLRDRGQPRSHRREQVLVGLRPRMLADDGREGGSEQQLLVQRDDGGGAGRAGRQTVGQILGPLRVPPNRWSSSRSSHRTGRENSHMTAFAIAESRMPRRGTSSP